MANFLSGKMSFKFSYQIFMNKYLIVKTIKNNLSSWIIVYKETNSFENQNIFLFN